MGTEQEATIAKVSTTGGLVEICTIVAFIFAAGCVIWLIRQQKTREKRKETFQPLQKMTIAAFIVIFVLHIPYYFVSRPAVYGEGAFAFLRPILMSLINSLRVFLLDINYDDIAKTFAENYKLYLCFVAVMYLIAPILTATNVLMLFRHFFGEIRLRYSPFAKNIYLFSELNPKSVAMAKSIAKRYGKKARIVFTDVLKDGNELKYDAVNDKELNRAIFLKKDITAFDFRKKKCRIEYFIIGSNESENIEQFIQLNEACKTHRNRSVYLYASSANARYVADSLDKGSNTLPQKLTDLIKKNPESFAKGEIPMNESHYSNENYYIRRIDHVNQFAIDTLTGERLIDALIPIARKDNGFSLTIIGLGSYGRAFLKNALWIFQLYGFGLTINLVDIQSNDNLLRKLRKEMPEIFAEKYRRKAAGDIAEFACEEPFENHYRIRIFGGVDCATCDIDRLFSRSEFGDTQLAMVTLGNDNKNIETAVNLRSCFDRLNGKTNKVIKNEIFYEEYNEKHDREVIVRNKTNEEPLIYAIVYEDKKAKGLDFNSENLGIVNHKHVPYHIRIAGSLSEQFDYETIVRQRKREQNALAYHIEWIRISSTMEKYYNMDASSLSAKEKKALQRFREKMQQHFHHQEPVWDHLYSFYKIDTDDKGAILRMDKKSDQQIQHETLGMVKQYEDYEYFRDSSISKQIHKDVIEGIYLTEGSDYFMAFDEAKEHEKQLPVCCCKRCEAKRISEHMRWNAYMRVNGFCYSPNRADRAFLHNDLKPWDQLNILEQLKD